MIFPFTSEEKALLKLLLRQFIAEENDSNWELGTALPKEDWQKSQDAISLAKDALGKLEWNEP